MGQRASCPPAGIWWKGLTSLGRISIAASNVCDLLLLPFPDSIRLEELGGGIHFSDRQSPELTLKASSAARNTYANGRRVIVWLTDTLSARINPEPLGELRSVLLLLQLLEQCHCQCHFTPERSGAEPGRDPDPGPELELRPRPSQMQAQSPQSQSRALGSDSSSSSSLSPAKDRVIHYQTCAIVCACV